MSNLSDIGFPVRSEQDVNDMIMQVVNHVSEVRCPNGFYLKFSDVSGAEIYLQGNFDQELIGFNPHFSGTSRRKVLLTTAIDRDSSELDGGFHAWANPQDETADSGDYPFVFNVPDFRAVHIHEFPKTIELQLTAFASNDFQIFASEGEFYANQTDELKFASKSFIPSGLFSGNENQETDLSLIHPIGIFAGEIKSFELKTNSLTNNDFYHFLVETLGGEVDVVADLGLIQKTPAIGGILKGQFWLSGKIL
ncbi:MAG TPA: hypothetical protein PKY59_03155 [Pyrinomonadaceae bacterium]|nr:hypothetical protein [Pyrinomonadaceae bacterium]